MFVISMLCIVGAVGSPLVVYLRYSGYGDYTGIANLGPIGDFVGGTTVTFLTAASVFLLIGTNIMQRKELQMSRQSVDEMVKQTKASVEQMAASVQQAEEARKETQITNETMKRQQFETTFFNMLQLHHQMVENMNVYVVRNNKSEEFHGRKALATMRDRFNKRISFDATDTINQDILNEIYEEFQDVFGNQIGHYMRNNYRIVKFIVENVVENEEEQKRIKKETGRDTIIGDKRFYFGTLRAQWSNAEFELIFINSLYKRNRKFKNLIKQHDVLDIKETDEEILKDKPDGSFVLKADTILSPVYKSLIEND